MSELNLQDILAIFRRRIFFILAFSLLFGAILLIWSLSQPKKFDVSVSFTINLTNKQNTLDYQYDGYYAIRASELLGDTIISWFLTPSEVLAIYQQAEIKPPQENLIKLTRRFKTTKFSGQNIVVRFSETDRDKAEKIAQALSNYLEVKAESLNKDSNGKSLFDIVASKPVTVETDRKILLNGILGLIAGLIISLSLIIIKEGRQEKI